jgi:hypothetical protein
MHYSILVFVNFDIDYSNYQSIATLIIAITFIMILMPVFLSILNNLEEEIKNELQFSFGVKNQFKKMFDSL